MNIVKFEVKRNLRTTLIWAVAVTVIGIFYTAMGPVFIDQSDTLMAFMEGMGDQFLTGLGINFDTFFSPVGFYSYVGTYMALALCVQAMIYGIKVLIVEKNAKSVEFLYTKPNSRMNIFVNKYIANIILLSITQLIFIVSIYIATDVINTVDYDHQLMLMVLLTVIPLQYLFFTLGTVIGAVANRLKNIVSVAIMVTLVMFFFNMLAGILDNDVLSYLSFFSYFNLSDIVFEEAYNMTFVMISIGLIIFYTVLSAVVLKIKDIKVI